MTELRTKLQQRGFDESEIEATLERLLELDLLSNERYAESYVRSCANRGIGPVRIVNDLAQRVISDCLIRQAMDQEELDWYALVRRVYDSKYPLDEPVDYKELCKRKRFLQQRGFDLEQIESVTDSVKLV